MGTPSSQSNGPLSQELYSQGPGTTPSDPFITVFAPRDPSNLTDINYPVKKRWINIGPLMPKEWILQNYSTVNGITTANWLLIASGTSTNLSLTGNTGGAVFPTLNNINVVGDGTTITFTGNPLTSTLTASLVGGGAAVERFNVQTGTTPVVPTAGAITVNGALVAAGTNPVRTDGTGVSTYAIEVQTAQAIATTNATNVGLAAFNSAQFTVDANGFVSITNLTPFHYTSITHNGTNPSPYTVTATDDYISVDTTAVTPGTVTILLPNAPTQFREFIIKDRTGAASTNNIFVTTVGGAVLIDGETTYTIAGNYGSIQLLFNGTSYEVF